MTARAAERSSGLESLPSAGRFGSDIWPVASATVGGALLMLRLAAPSGRLAGPATLSLLYLGLAAVSLSQPVPRYHREARLVHPLAALMLGLTAFAAAASMGLPAPAIGTVVPAALLLNTAAAISEEAFFRRFLFGWLERWGPVLASVLTALAFAAIHLPSYGVAAFSMNLGAGLVLSWQRWATGSWVVPAITHCVANLLAVYGTNGGFG
jgi:membrane protease YdiL (CAAX protease family)